MDPPVCVQGQQQQGGSLWEALVLVAVLKKDAAGEIMDSKSETSQHTKVRWN